MVLGVGVGCPVGTWGGGGDDWVRGLGGVSEFGMGHADSVLMGSIRNEKMDVSFFG